MSRGTRLASPRSLVDRTRLPLVLCVALGLLCGCGGEPGRAPVVEPLRIASAADLQHVLPKLLEAYGDRDGPVAPPTFGASGQLAEQIRGGAPFDVFLSADMILPGALETEGLVVAGSVTPYARGSLMLLVHPDVAAEVASISDLTKPAVRKIAIANPQVAPYGKAARDALESAGLWTTLEARIVPAGSVSQAFLHVEEGNADAALVSRSLVAGAASRIVEIDPALYPPRIQGLGIVSRSGKLDRARRFVDFIKGVDGGRILGDHGFTSPGD
ncbi:molybdate ABC transporter substrate-binding protein [Planctomyces sp. SH-PL62]|uniref:molybdate ABC transporter substrate-binding protein n=1 Tax=Planctomyces sp. SH-PL62 TaxID=1636152 RepID=UPI00078C01A3|nr:molybdate ABC transporter substrate-binding protein [Planctomyces sp. SH-PL62]AMV36622.1 Molybdate-binding periplasmic protein precursor [Planctomyces sp. SH-PL62]